MLSNIDNEYTTVYDILKHRNPCGIQFNNMNIKITEDGKNYYSVTYIVVDENIFPRAIPKNIKFAKSLLQKYFNTDTNINVKSISISLSKSNSEIIRKWQVVYIIHIDH